MPIVKKEAIKELKEDWLEYGMYVIENRAFPSICDGLKPSTRKVIYSMHEMGLYPSGGFKKVLQIVGHTSKYSVHGDSGTSGAITTAGQWFKNSIPLITNQGGFGELDNPKGAAADRYREAKLSSYAAEILLKDLSKESVPWELNYDETLQEPTVLPAIIPNLLVNGMTGIGVGFSCSYPTHSPKDVVKACIAYVKNRNISIDDLIDIIKAPDFPTGGVINGLNSVHTAYKTGKGSVCIRGRYKLGTHGSYQTINIYEIPFNIDSTNIVTKIAALADKGDIKLKDLNDLSDTNGLNIELVLKKDEDPQRVINILYTKTNFELRFPINMNALNENRELVLYNLKTMIEDFVKFRENTIHNILKAELNSDKDRLHILQGLLVLDGKMDECISIIRKSDGKNDAKDKIMKKYKLSETQSLYILNLPLYRLSKLEMGKIKEESKEIEERINVLTHITRSKSNKDVDKLMLEEWEELLNKPMFKNYKRKTEILTKFDYISVEDTIVNEPVTVVVTEAGYVKKIKGHDIKLDSGKDLAYVANDDQIAISINTMETESLLIITDKGHIFNLKVHSLEYDKRGILARNIFNDFKHYEKIVSILPHKEIRDKEIITITSDGMMKSTKANDCIGSTGRLLHKLNNVKTDNIVGVVINEGDTLCVVTKDGQILRMKSDINTTGTGGVGVIGMKLKAGDRVVSACESSGNYVTVINSGGDLKNIKTDDIAVKGRGGYGVIISTDSDIVDIHSGNSRDIYIRTETGLTYKIDTLKYKVGKRDTKAVNVTDKLNVKWVR